MTKNHSLVSWLFVPLKSNARSHPLIRMIKCSLLGISNEPHLLARVSCHFDLGCVQVEVEHSHLLHFSVLLGLEVSQDAILDGQPARLPSLKQRGTVLEARALLLTCL